MPITWTDVTKEIHEFYAKQNASVAPDEVYYEGRTPDFIFSLSFIPAQNRAHVTVFSRHGGIAHVVLNVSSAQEAMTHFDNADAMSDVASTKVH